MKEPGFYKGIISEVYFEEVGKKSTPALAFQVQMVKGPGGSEVQGQIMRRVRLWLTEKTVERSVSVLRTLGCEAEDWGDVLNHPWKGVNCEAVLSFQKGQDGNDYENWEFPAPNSVGKRKHSSVSPEDAAVKLNALFGRALDNGSTKGGI